MSTQQERPGNFHQVAVVERIWRRPSLQAPPVENSAFAEVIKVNQFLVLGCGKPPRKSHPIDLDPNTVSMVFHKDCRWLSTAAGCAGLSNRQPRTLSRLVIVGFSEHNIFAMSAICLWLKGKDLKCLNVQSRMILGWRPSLVGWRPSLVGWRPSLLGWKPFLLVVYVGVFN